MSQDYQQYRSLFDFSNGFDKSAASPAHHQEQQIRRDNNGLVRIEEEESNGLQVYESAGMLSEMFNFHPAATAAAELLEPPTIMGNFRQPPSTGLSQDWYGERPIINHNLHNPISAINADSASAMQLFLMNPRPRSPPSPHPPPSTSSTIHLQGFNSSVAPAGGASSQFSWLPDSSHGRTAPSSSHGLSLSLSSSLQHLEAAKADEFRMGVTSNLVSYNHGGYGIGPTQQVQAGFGSSLAIVNVLRNSKYLKASQQLLEDFCSVGRGEFKKSKLDRNNSNISSNPAISGSKDLPPLSATDRIEHQRRKVKLLSMLDEVDRRYNNYCEQMQVVVNSFDLVMGFGGAAPYTTLAHKAMSRHFRCLKDGINAQLKRSCEALGEKDGGRGSGITKGETPRLKMLEQSLRQQRAFHQMGGLIEQEAWRPQRGLPERSVNVLRSWLFEHFLHPYPSDADKHLLARQTGLSRNQVSNWFINARVRLWKPMVEDMYQQEAKEVDDDDDDDEDEDHEEEEEIIKEIEEIKRQNNRLAQTTMPTSKRSHINALENDPSINTQPFSQTQASKSTTTATVHVVEPPCFPATNDTCHLGSIVSAGYGTSSDNADFVGPTLIRFGTMSGDVSLTLGLRHAGNIPHKSSSFRITDFGDDRI